VPVGLCRASVDPAANEATSGSFQPVVGVVRVFPDRGGQDSRRMDAPTRFVRDDDAQSPGRCPSLIGQFR